MKFSTVAAGSAGALTAAVGICCAFLCPVAGLAAGAYLAYGGAVGAGMGLGASVALGAAGAAGGLIVGRIAAPVVAIASVGIGMAVGGVVKLFGSLFERLAGRGKPEQASSNNIVQAAPRSSFRAQAKLAASFAGVKVSAKAGGPANENAPPAQEAKRTQSFTL